VHLYAIILLSGIFDSSLRSGKARKNDPPIPKDLAPISSKPRKVQPKEDEFEPLPELIYPDQVSSFDQESMFAAKKELFEAPQPAEQAAASAQPEAEGSGEKQTRRPRRRRYRGNKPGTGNAQAPKDGE